MIRVMMTAEVGDDVFGEDAAEDNPEKKAAEMFGMKSTLFCPSRTMTNQLAIRIHCKPWDEVIFNRLSLIYLFDSAGIALNAFSSIDKRW